MKLHFLAFSRSNAQNQLLKLLVQLLRSGPQFRVITTRDDQSARKMIHQVHTPTFLLRPLDNQQLNRNGETSLNVVSQHREGYEGVSEEDSFAFAAAADTKQGKPCAMVEFLPYVKSAHDAC